MSLQPTELQPRGERQNSTRPERLTDRKRAEAYADYFDAYVDALPEHQRQAVYRGELDISARPDWTPPV